MAPENRFMGLSRVFHGIFMKLHLVVCATAQRSFRFNDSLEMLINLIKLSCAKKTTLSASLVVEVLKC